MNRIALGPLEFYGCADAVLRLEPYLDGELPRVERRRVAFHVAICRHCGPRFRFEARLDGRVRESLGEAGVPDEVGTRVRAALDEVRGQRETGI